MRATAVMVVGGLAMHWLCYLPGAGTGSAVGAGVHDYLVAATPFVLVVALGVIVLSLAIAFGAPARRDRGERSFEGQAARYAVALLGVFVVQEIAELFISGVGPQGADAILGAGGWLVVPASFFIGTVAAFGARTLDRVEQHLAERPPATVLAAANDRALPQDRRERSADVAVGLAFGFARRPPPSPLCV